MSIQMVKSNCSLFKWFRIEVVVMIKCQLIICLVFPLSSQPHYVFVSSSVHMFPKKNLLSSTLSNKRSLWFEKPLISHSDIMMFSLSISMKAAELVSSGDVSALICLVCAADTRGFVAPLQGRSSSYMHSWRVSGEVNNVTTIFAPQWGPRVLHRLISSILQYSHVRSVFAFCSHFMFLIAGGCYRLPLWPQD